MPALIPSQIRFLTKRIEAVKAELLEPASDLQRQTLQRDIADLEHRLNHAKLLASTYD